MPVFSVYKKPRKPISDDFHLAYNKKTREPILTDDSLLGGGYLRLPVSLTGGVVTLRALCLERDEAGQTDGYGDGTSTLGQV